jgi:hypothetical protein
MADEDESYFGGRDSFGTYHGWMNVRSEHKNRYQYVAGIMILHIISCNQEYHSLLLDYHYGNVLNFSIPKEFEPSSDPPRKNVKRQAVE